LSQCSCPLGEKAGLGKRVKLGDAEPVTFRYQFESRVVAVPFAEFLENRPGSPAFVVGEQPAKNVEAISPSEVAETRRVQH
jgi:hypothetical protein